MSLYRWCEPIDLTSHFKFKFIFATLVKWYDITSALNSKQFRISRNPNFSNIPIEVFPLQLE